MQPTVVDERDYTGERPSYGHTVDILQLPSSQKKKNSMLPKTAVQMQSSGSNKDLLFNQTSAFSLQKSVLGGGGQSGKVKKYNSPQLMREAINVAHLAAINQADSQMGRDRYVMKKNSAGNNSNLASLGITNAPLGKPSLKLLLAQQTVKPDPAARSPPITSNCQSQSSIATTQTKNSPKSSLSNTANKMKTRNIQNSLGTLLQHSQTMLAKQQTSIAVSKPTRP